MLFSLILTLGAFNVAELFFALDDLHSSTLVYGLSASAFTGESLVAALVNEVREVTEPRMPFNMIFGALMVGGAVI